MSLARNSATVDLPSTKIEVGTRPRTRAHLSPSPHLAKWTSLTVTMFGGIAFALLLGQDGNGDQRAFHTYNVWLLLHPGQDPAAGVGDLGGLVPSAWNIPWYFLIRSAPAWTAVGYLGALHGLAVWLSGAVTWTVLRQASTHVRIVLTLMVTLVSFAAPATLAEFATTFGNLTTAIPILLAVLIYLRRPSGILDPARAWWIGLLLGLAFGLKTTNAVALCAFALAMLVSENVRATTLRPLLYWATGAIVGALATGGYWAVLMWHRFSNPLFPFYNGIFRSPYGPTNNIYDAHYATRSLRSALLMPFRMLTVGGYPSETGARDSRWALLLALGLLTLIYIGWRRWRKLPAPIGVLIATRDRRFVLTFLTVGWIVWLIEFSIARYLIPLELVSALAILAMIDLLIANPLRKTLVFSLAGLMVLQFFTVPGWLRKDYHGSWYDLQLPAIAQQENLIAVFPGSIMFDFAVIGLPEDARVVHLPVAFDNHNAGIVRGDGKEDRENRQFIERHRGPVISITDWKDVPQSLTIARGYGFTLRRQDCRPLKSKFGDAAVCPWVRAVAN